MFRKRLNNMHKIISILLITILLLAFTQSVSANEMPDTSYVELLFDTSVIHSVDIVVSDDDWEDLKKNPLSKTKYSASVTIDGETVENVSFSTKGLNSLSSVASDPDSDRYSFKINFGKFESGKTWHGLDKLNLSAMYADAAYMKDFMSYELFRKAGVDAPLVSYVWLTVNGQAHGLYAAIEDANQSFLNRTAEGEGVLYKPEPDYGGEDRSGNSKAGTSLIYTDDEISSYPEIFDNAETKANISDMQRVVAALKVLSEKKKLDSALYTDEIIRYFAVHNFLLNFDSYTSQMRNNYCLYERDGKLAMLPWDYNMAFGCFSGIPELVPYRAETTPLINMGIDTPLIGVSAEERPMWQWITEEEDALQQYHDVLESLISSYIEPGIIDEQISELYVMLLPYVEKDPSAFYSAEEFKVGVQAMKQYFRLRSASVRAQLDGSLSTVWEDQNPEDRVDCSDFSPFMMGTQVHVPGQGD